MRQSSSRTTATFASLSSQARGRVPVGTVNPGRVSNLALRLAGLDGEGYRFHDLRNTCVSRLVAAGADIKLVQAVAAHANPLITLKRATRIFSTLASPRQWSASIRPASSRVTERLD